MKSMIKVSLSVLLVLIAGVLTFGQSNLVTKTSVGDLKLGMTVGEARKALPSGYKLAPGGGSEGVTFIGVFDGKKHLMDIGEYGETIEKTDKNGKITGYELPPIDENKKIRAITIIDSRFKTADGVHIGMSIAEAERKLGKLKEMFNFPHQGEFGKFSNQPMNMGFNFRVKGDSNTAGIYEEIPDCKSTYPPACRKAMKYTKGSYISSMSISIPPPAQKIVSINGVPKGFKVQISGPTKCDDEDEGKTRYSLWTKKGNMTDYQEFVFKGLMPCLDEGVQSQNVTEAYKDQFNVFFGDFNFDGMTDLALRDGMNGGYGFPSYQIYLYSKAKSKFVRNASFTELGQYQGMFEVDKKKKMIFNKTKSGAAFYQTDGYIVRGDKLIKVYEETKEYMSENDAKVTVKKLVDGKWVVVKK